MEEKTALDNTPLISRRISFFVLTHAAFVTTFRQVDIGVCPPEVESSIF
jgi:hypothetical protein